MGIIFLTLLEYKIENVNNLKKRCEKAMKIVPNYGEFTKNYFSIKKEKLSDIITQWQNNYPDLYYELEQWKEGTGFTHETIALLRKTKSKKVVECVFLKIYESEGTDILNCVNIYRNYPKPSKILKARNIIFKHKSEKLFNQLIKSHSKIMAALILSGNNGNDGLKILWN
ncbi:hypothetical protein RhiirA5_398680 [Rhizophagus irregularis]|uniref:Uncharacterized protein n=3 Tax=Rhizophagus irregularis TaxID=588596 RepID=A0A2I1EHP6_9GLOM|nr:hypothetical protein RhiirA5_398680 [Rhizophagus irregularis]PKC67784.1 hypothetical protein RhiirA1_534650 [Rhizophagus irregularis]PKY21640.1 hypothetical protein RhiirB3_525184 [Rhizophagus irregularis]CAG8466376.1 15855_t:CDS:2 [Rhizophagus irregularis]